MLSGAVLATIVTLMASPTATPQRNHASSLDVGRRRRTSVLLTASTSNEARQQDRNCRVVNLRSGGSEMLEIVIASLKPSPAVCQIDYRPGE